MPKKKSDIPAPAPTTAEPEPAPETSTDPVKRLPVARLKKTPSEDPVAEPVKAKKRPPTKAPRLPRGTAKAKKQGSAPVAKVKKAKSAVPAVENKVPRVKAIKSRHFDEAAVRLGVMLSGMLDITIARFRNLEYRNVPDRIQVMLNEEVKLPCRKCYTQEEETTKISKWFRQVPSEFWPVKWQRAFEAQASK